MTFKRTHDYRMIRSFLTDSKLWVRMVNDAAPKPENFQIQECDGITYVVGIEAGMIARALFLLCSTTEGPTTAEVHCAMAPEVWGRTKAVVEAFMRWVWRETSLTRLVAPCPGYNRLITRLALSAGFVHYQTGEAVYKHGNTFHVERMEALRPA